jgi:hypothetical protein
MACEICGRERVLTGHELGGQPGTCLNESSCHDGVWMDDDEHAEGWQPDVAYPPCPESPRRCLTCNGSGRAPKLMAESLNRDDCADCNGTGWKDGNCEWPIAAADLEDEEMSKCIAAHTNPGADYPGYINFTREEDGTVSVHLRGNPSKRDGVYVCSHTADKGKPGRCTPGDERCNNYCNMAPQKGKMQDAPLPCNHTDTGAIETLTLSADAFKALVVELSANPL